MSAFPDGLGVVVLAYGSPDPAAALVGRVRAEGVPAEAITVVHNGAAPDAPWPGDPGVEVLRGPNRGYAGGMNDGVRARLERGDALILLLTHDARFAPGALRLLHAAAQRHPEVGLFGPRLDDPCRGRIFSLGVRIGPTGGTHHLVTATPRDGLIRCDGLDGAFMLVRARVFADAGMFDEQLFMYFEETELALRARRCGWQVAVVPEARAEQEGGEGRRPGVFAYLRIRNGLVFSWRAKRWIGLAGWLFRVAMYLVMYGRRILDPRRSPAGRRAAAAAVAGVLLGARDGALGRLGPPPRLPGMGDVRVEP
jgi:GT2 family glycosyltransferase